MKFCIYTITSNFDKSAYIGSTTNLQKRESLHQRVCGDSNNKRYMIKLYQFVRDNGGWANFSIKSIEELDCNNSFEARQREQFFIDKYLCDGYNILNTINAFTDYKKYQQEYYKANRTNILEQTRLYKNKNIEKYKDYLKNYVAENKEKIRDYKKKFEQNNKENIAITKKKYYEENKEKILQKHSENFTCECGGKYSYSHKSRHMKSQVHQQFLCNSS